MCTPSCAIPLLPLIIVINHGSLNVYDAAKNIANDTSSHTHLYTYVWAYIYLAKTAYSRLQKSLLVMCHSRVKKSSNMHPNATKKLKFLGGGTPQTLRSRGGEPPLLKPPQTSPSALTASALTRTTLGSIDAFGVWMQPPSAIVLYVSRMASTKGWQPCP